jgi:hypothetical protein
MPASSELNSGSAVYGASIERRRLARADEAGVKTRQKARYCLSAASDGVGSLLGFGCEAVAASELVASAGGRLLGSRCATPVPPPQPLAATAAVSTKATTAL